MSALCVASTVPRDPAWLRETREAGRGATPSWPGSFSGLRFLPVTAQPRSRPRVVLFQPEMRCLVFGAITAVAAVSASQQQASNHVQGAPYLHPPKLDRLPAGSILPDGWLLRQAELMSTGLTGALPFWHTGIPPLAP